MMDMLQMSAVSIWWLHWCWCAVVARGILSETTIAIFVRQIGMIFFRYFVIFTIGDQQVLLLHLFPAAMTSHSEFYEGWSKSSRPDLVLFRIN